MSLRTAYYKTWMVTWSPDDRETVLSEAYMKVTDESLPGALLEPSWSPPGAFPQPSWSPPFL